MICMGLWCSEQEPVTGEMRRVTVLKLLLGVVQERTVVHSTLPNSL